MKKDSIGNKYSQELYAKTKFYQKRYGFKLESLDGDTHNFEDGICHPHFIGVNICRTNILTLVITSD